MSILVGHGFASLARIWISHYSLAAALVGEFAPTAATDSPNVMVFAPLLLVTYTLVQERVGREKHSFEIR